MGQMATKTKAEYCSIGRLEYYMERIRRTNQDRLQIAVLLEAARDDSLSAEDLVRLDMWCKSAYPGKILT